MHEIRKMLKGTITKEELKTFTEEWKDEEWKEDNKVFLIK